MRKNDLEVKTLFIDVPFYEHIEGDFDIMNELFSNYLSRTGNIEKIKKFMIMDYLTSLDDDEFSKMFSNFKTNKLNEKEETTKGEELNCSNDVPF